MANRTNTMHQWVLALEQAFDFQDAASGGAHLKPKLPMGAIIRRINVVVETVFNGGAASSVSVGIAGNTTKYANAVDLDAATGTVAAATPTGIPLAEEETLLFTFSANAIASTAGKGRLVIEYIVAGRGNEAQP